ncbi:hypothetical protein Tco_1023784, partial [Tanacetum coccineum]
MTTPITTSTTDSQMHNNIMAAGLRDRPPMLALGRYAQWQSRFLRYIDTRPNGDALRKCILEVVKTILNMSLENKVHYESEKEAIHLLLTGIRNEIYSTVDAYETAHEIWIAIESCYNTSQCLVSSTTSTRMVKYQKEVNEIHAEKKAKNANLLALVAAASPYPDPYYQAPKYHKPYAPISKQSSSTRSNEPTKHKVKEIAKPITSLSESASEEDNDPEQAQKDNDMQKNLALITKYFKKLYKPTNNNLRTSSNSSNKNVDTSLRYVKDNLTGQFGNQRTVTIAGARETVGSQECRKPNRVKDYSYHKEKKLCKQAEKGVPLQAEQADWLADKDEEIDEQELEAHYSYMAKIQEVPTVDSGTDTEPLEQTDQNTVECDDERVVLANLISNLKLDVDENKKIQKQLRKSNTSLAHELKECKSILAETSRTLRESNSIRDSCLIALQNKMTELERTISSKKIDIKEDLKLKAYEISVVKEKHDELVKQSLLTKSHYEGLIKEKTKVITDLKLKEDEGIDKMISMEKQLKFLNEIVYKRNQLIQTIHMLAPKGPTFNGRPTFANPMYLKKAQSEKPCLYEILYDPSDPANRLVPDREETLTLENESRSKLNKDLVRPYDYTKLNKLVDQAWEKHSHNHFRAPTAHDMEIIIKTCLMPLAIKTQNDSFTFVHELKQEMHADLKYVESLKNEIDELESDKAEFSNMYNILLQECVSNDVR